MIYITTNGDTLRIKNGNDDITVLRSGITGLLFQRSIAVFMLAGNTDRNVRVELPLTFDGTLVSNREDLLSAYVNFVNSGSVIQVFTATAGQTIFDPVFECNASTKVYVNGYRTLSGFSINSGDVVFTNPFMGGEEVVIENA
jgi:hypothetical protein